MDANKFDLFMLSPGVAILNCDALASSETGVDGCTGSQIKYLIKSPV
jgi:hypothetical protein